MRKFPLFSVAALAAVAVSVAVGRGLFTGRVGREVDQLRQGRQRGRRRELAALPPLMRRYLQLVLPAHQRASTETVMRQDGHLRTAPTAGWQSFQATQHISAMAPGFVWAATLFPVYVRDKYLRGRGETLVSLLGLKAIDRADGPETNQGAQLRYLAEVVWLPAAFLDDRIAWQEAGPDAVAATLALGGSPVRALFHFDAAGYVRQVVADRHYRAGGTTVLRRWTASLRRYRPLAGTTIPTEATVTWHLPDGEFTWLNMRVLSYEAA